MKHRGARNIKGDYFGPFASAGAVNRTINTLQRAFLLRSCSDSFLREPHAALPAPSDQALLGALHRRDHDRGLRRLVDEARASSRARPDAVQKKLSALMAGGDRASSISSAPPLRDRLWALAHVTGEQGINPRGVEEADVFAVHQEGGQTCVQVFFFRAEPELGQPRLFSAGRPRSGRRRSSRPSSPSSTTTSRCRADALSPRVPERALLAEALSTKAERKVEIALPQAGREAGLVEHALRTPGKRWAANSPKARARRKLLDGSPGLRSGTRRARIEVYDNTHIMGTNAVGGMIVAGPEGFVKNQYRKFNIKSDELTPGDDYAMMREVCAPLQAACPRSALRLRREMAIPPRLWLPKRPAPSPGRCRARPLPPGERASPSQASSSVISEAIRVRGL